MTHFCFYDIFDFSMYFAVTADRFFIFILFEIDYFFSIVRMLFIFYHMHTQLIYL